MIPIVYEHEDWLLCHKPNDMDFHDDNGVLGFLSQLKAQVSDNNLLPVHRLDKPTSGLILVAKNHAACAQLCELFAQRKIEKFYVAICPSSLKKKQGLIIGDMAKSRRGTFKLLKSKENPAITQFFSHGLGEGKRLCLLKPSTGKTHQLRVACKSLGAAIVGDQAYGAEEADRLYLHAYALRFSYKEKTYEFIEEPNNGQYFLQDTFNTQFQEWQSPWSLSWPKLKHTP